MRRLILLALGLSVLLGTAGPRVASAPPDIFTITGAGSCMSAPAHTPADSDHQWHPAQRTTATISESSWKTMPAHAAPAGVGLDQAFDRARTGSPPSLARSALPYLRHTPLLI